MGSVRKRPVTCTSADAISWFMNKQMKEHAGMDVKVRMYTQNADNSEREEQLESVLSQHVQDVSVAEKSDIQVIISDDASNYMRVVSYSGSNPGEVTISDSKRGMAELYLDEVCDMKVRHQYQPQQQRQQVQEKVTQLVGVSKNSLRFRNDANGSQWVNVAVPWSASKNGLGNLDIPREDFDRENTPEQMAKRTTYHVPLKQESYGLWYIDKVTGKPTKPQVSTDKIYQAYESNRSAYRAARITSTTKEEPAVQAVDSPDFALDDIDFG